jgi:hypothetical protein
MRQAEKVEQAHGIKLLLALGARVYVSGTRRRRGDYPGTMQTPGIPDVEAWLPQPRTRDTRMGGPLRVLLKWECKRAGGRLSDAQREYQQLCGDADVAHVVGPLDELIGWLIDADYLRPDQVAHYRLPAGRAS